MSQSGIKFRSSSVKSLKSSSILQPSKLQIISKQPFQINPAHIVFKDIQHSKDYQVKVEIRNLTKKPQRIRFEKFKNPRFVLQAVPQTEIAVGLSIFVIVRYQCMEEVAEVQILKVHSSDGFTQQLSINTYPKKSKIVFDPFVNLGFVEQNTQCTRQITIQNQGQKSGQLKFISTEPTMLTIQPQTINLNAKSSSTLTIKYKPIQAGYFKGIIEIKSSQILAKNFIEVVATSLEKARFIVNPNKSTFQEPDMVFDFRTVYAGQQKVLKAFLINNSPKPMKFKTLTKKGLLENAQEATMNHTPAEQALQERQKVFILKPQQGTVEPFTEFQLELKCQSKISYKQKTYVTSYAMADYSQQGSITSMRNAKDFKHQKTYEYTAIVKSQEEKPMLLHLKATITCPQIKVSKKALLFGDCMLQESKKEQLFIQNKNKSEKVSVVLPKIPYIDFVPSKFVLESERSKTIEVIFRPKVIGKIDQTQPIVINDLYEIPLRCMGIVKNERSMSQKQLSKLSIDNAKVNQSPNKKFSSRRLSVFQTQKSTKTLENDSEMNYLTHRKLGSLGNLQLDPKTKAVSMFIENKQKFSKLLTSRRQDREKKQAQKQMKDRYSQMKEKLQKQKKNQTYDDQGLPESSPVDIQFELGSIKDIRQRQPKLSKVPERLYVTKHIGSYQPQGLKNGAKSSFTRTSEDKPKRIFPQVPQIFNQRRQIERQLSIEQLQLIQVPETKIYFGQVYVKSECTRYFWLRNNTRFAVSCKVVFNSPQLSKSYSKAQTIPSYQQAGFALVLCRHALGDYFAQGQYIINDKYRYKLSVVAKVGQVVIIVNKENLKFEFPQNNLEMNMVQNVTLTNPGNSEAKFRWTLGKEKYFIPQAIQGVVQPKQTITVPIQLNLASIIKSLKKPSDLKAEQKLSLKILDGQQKPLTCLFSMLEPKYTTKCELFSKKSTIFLNNQLTEFLEIKNTTKQAIVIHLSTVGVDIVSSDKIRLMPDETKRIKVKFIGEKVGEFQCSVGLNIRGGVKKDFQFSINVIEPQLLFSAQQLHMQPLIVRSTKGQAFFTLSHKQQLPIPLVFDFRPKRYNKSAPQHIQHLQIKILNQGQALQAVSPTLKSEQDQNIINQNLVQQKIDIDEIEDRLSNQSFDDQQQTLEKDEQQMRRYRLMVKPGIEYKFRVEFVAPQVGVYKIKVPIEIEKSVKVGNSPLLKCQAIQPKFVFEPSNIDFKKKYIGKPQRSFPKIVEIIVRNDNFQPIEWNLDCSSLESQKIFSFQPFSGHLLPNQSTKVKSLFNPFTTGQFNTTLPLYIKSQKQSTRIKFCTVSLKGTSSQPQLYFNKREVIMPVVPLGVETSTFFRILNDGYDNLNLAWEFEDDVMGLDVKLAFPQGNNVGISRQKVRVDLSWKYDKPISFTIVLTFKDDMGRKFRIPISGTTDNSILTNYMYLLRNEHKFKIKQQGALQLFQLNHNTTATTSLQRKHSSHSLKSNSTNRSIMSYLGIAPINPYVLSTTLEYIKKYLNENVLTIPIAEFPQSLVEGDGRQIVEVITVTAGKGAKYPWLYQGNAKGEEKVKKLMLQYGQMIKMLKTQGAMLNHIRPQYLLSFQDLNLYLSTLPAQKSRCYMPNLLKINSGLYNYLSVESWTSLLYQILKLNVVSRVSVKNIKSHVPFYKEKDIPSHYLEKSNFLSVSESILLHWCEEAYHEVLFKEIRLMNFDKDFKSGVVIGAVIERYAKNSLTARLVIDTKTEEDEKKNAKIICQSLEEMGLLGHVEPKYIFSPFQRQMVMLVMYLYLYLPAYIPKDKPIIFDCVLGQQIVKSIELKNPSSKPLKYKAKYVGSANFILLSDEIFTIQPKSSYDFRIKYVSRFVRQIKGRVSFVNLKDKTTGQGGSLSGSTVVFELKSKTIQVLSEKTWKVASNLYEPSEYTVQVDNNIDAPENTEFTLKIRTQYLAESNNKKKTKHTEETSLLPQQQVQVILFKSETIKVKKGSLQSLSFTYLPMSLHKTKTYVLFSNQFVGQFQHEIQATPQEPALTAEFKPNLTMYAGDTHDWEYMLTAKNEFLQKAKKTYEGLTVKKVKAGTAGSPGKSKVKVTNQVEDSKDATMGSKKYEIEIEQNQNVGLVENFVVLTEQTKKDKKSKPQKPQDNQTQQHQTTQQNSIKFKFTCKQPIFQFPLKIRIKDPKSLDIRLYRLILTILPKPLAAVLQMTTPQRKQLIQELPFINHTEKDWNMKVNWTGGNGFSLGGNSASGFVVKRQSIFKLPVVFKPKVKEDSEAKLVVINPMTLDQFEYQIKGHVEDPLSQDHIDIQCGINEPITRSLQLVNPYPEKSISLRVQTDIPNFEGESRLTIPPNGKLTYQFKLTAMICGEFNSCITFWEVQGPQYFWFTVTVRTSVGSAAMSVDVESEIRQRKIQQINIPMNFKLKVPEDFDVSVKGQGVLAPQKVTLYPQDNKAHANKISIEYLPLKQGTSFGSLYLVNPRVGQVLIDLNLICHAKPPYINHLIKSPLGVGSKQQITLANPINAKISISYKNSNPETFVVILPQAEKKSLNSSVIKLQPFEKKTIKVQYIPGSIDSIQKTQIVFISQQVGNWEYHFSGIGVAPTQFDPLIVYRELSWIEPSSIKFKNPFNYAISVGIKMIVQPEWKDVFRLNLIGKEIIAIEPHGNIEVPFVFAPEAIAQYFCNIKILLSDKIFWTFPIVGIAQSLVKQTNITLKAKCRQTVRIEKSFHLQGVEKFANNNSYQLKFLNIPHDIQSYVELFVQAQLTKKSLQNDKDNLVAQFLFRPMKPFKTTFDLSIERQNGGRWIHKLHIEATLPQFDDRIQLQSAIMSTSSVSFRITNKDKKQVPFKAYLTQDSAHEFSVEPSSGILAKYGSKGTQIKISFTPVEYGKDKAGKLVIETDEMYWWYEVIGRLPKYVPPGKKTQSMKKL